MIPIALSVTVPETAVWVK